MAQVSIADQSQCSHSCVDSCVDQEELFKNNEDSL